MNTYSPAPTVEEDFVNLVRLELDDIKRTFFKIGFRLREANNEKYYLKLGFESIEECAEALFGFGKTTTYDLMRIASLFKSDKAPMQLDTRYEGFSQSQLVLFSQINLSQREFINMASPSDSIANLKKAKSYWNKVQRGNIQGFLGYGRCRSINEFIEKIEDCNPELTVIPEKEDPVQLAIDENSGYPEKPAEVIVENVPDPAEEPEETEIESSESISDYLIPACEKFLTRMGYKTIFDPDDKGLGLRVLPNTLSKQMVEEMLKAFSDHRTAIKNSLKNSIIDRLGKYDYEINLCGKKQAFSQFCGNIGNCIMDLFFDEWRALIPEKKERKKNK